MMIIDGGPRKTFNTAAMLGKIAEGARSVSDEIEVKTVRLYDIDYKGCMSCMACKLKGKVSNVCKFRDALTPILEEVAQADGLVLGSPIYFSEVTAQLRAFLERLIFAWLSYNDYSLTAPKQMPVLLTYTMNANEEQAKMIYQMMGIVEDSLKRAMGDVEHVDAYSTYQVKNYDRYELAVFPEPMKREQDLQRAYDAGKRMAEKISAR
ncbi:flavodoxin family protein [Prevotella sp. Rep29]|uniref:flavodoxin family protein n=1 Tax=Prevotella sp. Rep29 TaxID=2691580 RepID=UPI001C6E8FEF|nr:flavodoxin family protein [Prevotella sp. Rep29]QYR10810.1 flavodoxin family protein [Prevotella sp. Rep29]